jgi:hypothetical protein
MSRSRRFTLDKLPDAMNLVAAHNSDVSVHPLVWWTIHEVEFGGYHPSRVRGPSCVAVNRQTTLAVQPIRAMRL